MNPREFFDQIAAENARMAVARPGDVRLAVNAIMTLDGFFGVLHAALRDAGSVQEESDDSWKETLARKNDSYRLLRDSAYALKHGNLAHKKPRLVRRPDQIFQMPGAFDPAVFDSRTFSTGTVWIETEATDYRANEMIENVLDFSRAHLEG